MSSVKVDFKQLEQFQKKIDGLANKSDEFLEACSKELAARLLRLVIKRTPVGQYPSGSGKKGGTLRRAWTTSNQNFKIVHSGSNYQITVVNPTEYASYVEYGHRTIKKDGFGWAEGHLMLTISENELRQIAPQILESKLKKWMSGVMK